MKDYLFNLYTDGDFFTLMISYIIKLYNVVFSNLGDLSLFFEGFILFSSFMILLFYSIKKVENGKRIFSFEDGIMKNPLVNIGIFMTSIYILFYPVNTRVVKLVKIVENNENSLYAKKYGYKPVDVEVKNFLTGETETYSTFKTPLILSLITSIPNMIVYGIPIDDISDKDNKDIHRTKYLNIFKIISYTTDGKAGKRDIFTPSKIVSSYFDDIKKTSEQKEDIKTIYDYLYRLPVYSSYSILAEGLNQERNTNKNIKAINGILNQKNIYNEVIKYFEDYDFYNYRIELDTFDEWWDDNNAEEVSQTVQSPFLSLKIQMDRSRIDTDCKIDDGHTDIGCSYPNDLNEVSLRHKKGYNDDFNVYFGKHYDKLFKNPYSTSKDDADPITITKSLYLNRQSLTTNERSDDNKYNGFENTNYGLMTSDDKQKEFYKDFFNAVLTEKRKNIFNKLTDKNNIIYLQNFNIINTIFNISFYNNDIDVDNFDDKEFANCIGELQYNTGSKDLLLTSGKTEEQVCVDKYNFIYFNSEEMINSRKHLNANYIDEVEKYKEDLWEYSKVSDEYTINNDIQNDLNIKGIPNEEKLRENYLNEIKEVYSKNVNIINNFLSPVTDLILFDNLFLNKDSMFYKTIEKPDEIAKIKNNFIGLYVKTNQYQRNVNSGDLELISDTDNDLERTVDYATPVSSIQTDKTIIRNIKDFLKIDKLVEKYKNNDERFSSLSEEKQEEIAKLYFIEDILNITISNIEYSIKNDKDYLNNIIKEYKLNVNKENVINYYLSLKSELKLVSYYKEYLLNDDYIKKISQLKLHQSLLLNSDNYINNVIMKNAYINKNNSDIKPLNKNVLPYVLKIEAGYYYSLFYQKMLLEKLSLFVIDDNSDDIDKVVSDTYDLVEPETKNDFTKYFGYLKYGYINGNYTLTRQFDETGDDGEFDKTKPNEMKQIAIDNYKSNIQLFNKDKNLKNNNFFSNFVDGFEKSAKFILSGLSEVIERELNFSYVEKELKSGKINGTAFKGNGSETIGFTGYHINPFETYNRNTMNNIYDLTSFAFNQDFIYTSYVNSYDYNDLETFGIYHTNDLNYIKNTVNSQGSYVARQEDKFINQKMDTKVIDGNSNKDLILMLIPIKNPIKVLKGGKKVYQTGKFILSLPKKTVNIVKTTVVKNRYSSMLFGATSSFTKLGLTSALGLLSMSMNSMFNIVLYSMMLILLVLISSLVIILKFLMVVFKKLFLPLLLAKINFLKEVVSTMVNYFIIAFTSNDLLDITDEYYEKMVKEVKLIFKYSIYLTLFFTLNYFLMVYSMKGVFMILSIFISKGVISLPINIILLAVVVFIFSINIKILEFLDNDK